MPARSDRWILLLSLILAALALGTAAGASAGEPAPQAATGSAAEAAFARLAALAGTWQGTNDEGDAVESRYELVAGGTALLERYANRDKGYVMVTVYHRDGDRLVLTHYCVAGNQPRMVAVPDGGDALRFEFDGATGLDTPGEGHMHRAVVRPGADRLTAEWTFYQDGGPSFTAATDLHRVGGGTSAGGR